MTNVPLQPTVPKMPIPLKYTLKYIGSLDDLRTRGRSFGEICIYKGVQYIWVNDIWEPLEDTPNTPKMIKSMSCTQCGASLHGSICEYCGTEYR